jgi:hypothetical protein
MVITKSAEDDLRGIAEYIALELKEPLTAQNLLASFGELFLN